MIRESFSGHFVVLKTAVDSVDRPALWSLLRSPLKMVSLIRELYSGTFSSVRMVGILSDWFEIRSDVRQGCTIAPSVLLSPWDWIVESTVHRGLAGASLGVESFSDPDYADDVALLVEIVRK